MPSDQPDPIDTRHSAEHDRPVRSRSSTKTFALAVLVGVVFGPLVLAGQVHTPYPFANLFNSPAIWAAVAFVFGLWAIGTYRSIVGAVVAMVIAVESYYLADIVVRGANTSNLTSPTAILWILLGIGAGVIFGAAGATVDYHRTTLRIVAKALLPSVFASEAVHQVIEHFTNDPGAGRDDSLQFAGLLALFAVGSAALILSIDQRLERWKVIATTITITAVGTVAYSLLTT